jgi:hypothetical protein
VRRRLHHWWGRLLAHASLGETLLAVAIMIATLIVLLGSAFGRW